MAFRSFTNVDATASRFFFSSPASASRLPSSRRQIESKLNEHGNDYDSVATYATLSSLFPSSILFYRFSTLLLFVFSSFFPFFLFCSLCWILPFSCPFAFFFRLIHLSPFESPLGSPFFFLFFFLFARVYAARLPLQSFSPIFLGNSCIYE